MSIAVVGLSFGAQSCVIAQAKRGGVDVILNESSQRLNPSIVSYVGNERALGEAGKNQVRPRVRRRAAARRRWRAAPSPAASRGRAAPPRRAAAPRKAAALQIFGRLA